jgi:hypothetical protein
VSASILYVSSDGIMQPLGYSQVLRVVRGLAERGLRYSLVSAEQARDLEDAARVQATRTELADHGIRWTATSWDRGSAATAAGNLARIARAVIGAARRERATLVHARSYHAAAVARLTQRITGAPFVFDARGYWIDERLEAGRWFSNPLASRVARSTERRIYGAARAIVTLTRLHARDLEDGRMGRLGARMIETIPTVCDYGAFVRASAPEHGPWTAMPPARPVVAIIGAINNSYRMDATVALARRILDRVEAARLLVLSAQADGFRRLLDDAAIPRERCTITSASHEEMPGWLSRADWAITLLRASPAKRASVPTKLAEFFAAGVRPIHHGCNDEVTEWVRRAGSGFVLDDLEPASLDRCAEHVATRPAIAGEIERARDLTRAHFDLSSGLDRYERVIEASL